MAHYDPWAELARLGHLRLVEAPLPPSVRGLIHYASNTITLSPDLMPVEKTCTLAHELVHAERGPVIVRLTAREEATVAAIAARRLVPLDRLIDAFRCGTDQHLIADELGVDARTVRTRLRVLTDAERATIDKALETSPHTA